MFSSSSSSSSIRLMNIMGPKEEVTLDSLRLEPLRDGDEHHNMDGVEFDDGRIITRAAARIQSLGAAAETIDRISSSKYQEVAKDHLGGYQNRKTQCSDFNTALTQFDCSPSHECTTNSRRMESSSSMCARETQTLDRRSQDDVVNTQKEHGTQIYSQGPVLLDYMKEGKANQHMMIHLRRLGVTSERVSEQHTQNIITIQRYWRKHVAKQHMRQRRRQIEDQQRVAKEIVEHRRKIGGIAGVGLAANKKQGGRIKIKQEGVLPKHRGLDIISQPQLWTMSNGQVIEVHHPSTMRAKRLSHLHKYLAILQWGDKSQEYRIKILTHVKEEVKQNTNDNDKLVQEIHSLVEREIYLLNRGRKDATLVNLRIRIATLFDKFCEITLDGNLQ